jgi:hypothetical protein
MWGNGPFESDGGLDEVFALLDHLAGRIEGIACGTAGDRSSVIRDEQELAAAVESLCLIAEAVYRPAMFVPIRGLPLPDAEAVQGWRREFAARYGRLAKKQLEGTPDELERFARQAAAPLDRLAELSRQQAEAAEATHQQVTAEVVDARRREAAEE